MKQFLINLAQIIPEDQLDIPKRSLRENVVTNGLQIFFGVAAAVAVLIVGISAFRIVISRGNAQDVQKARDSILYAVIGLAITMSGFVIVTFVIERVS